MALPFTQRAPRDLPRHATLAFREGVAPLLALSHPAPLVPTFGDGWFEVREARRRNPEPLFGVRLGVPSHELRMFWPVPHPQYQVYLQGRNPLRRALPCRPRETRSKTHLGFLQAPLRIYVPARTLFGLSRCRWNRRSLHCLSNPWGLHSLRSTQSDCLPAVARMIRVPRQADAASSPLPPLAFGRWAQREHPLAIFRIRAMTPGSRRP